MKKLLFIILFFIPFCGISQTFVGRTMVNEQIYSMQYTRVYEESDGIFTTIYKTVDEHNYHYTVTAINYKSQHKITVKSVEGDGSGMLDKVKEYTLNYTDEDGKNGKGFGQISGDAMLNSNSPWYITVTFVSEKRENVNVWDVLVDNAGIEVYLLF